MRKKKDTETPESVDSVVYCGPSIIGVAKQFSIYTNGIPPSLQAKAEEIPAILALIISLGELPAAREQMRSCKGPIYSIFLEVQRIIKGGK